MSLDPKEFYASYREELRALRRESPELLEGFNTFYHKFMGEGRLDLKAKELISLGIGVAIHCERCILIHVRSAWKAGASREEIMEAAGVGVVMGGGPAFTQLTLVKKAFDSLVPE
ncbi:MAG TPA: carboxymuconolactone decarboxylase family protein [Atribacteraceae bacterium]|nr:carboxymuconolactone decarboxylase family protein [Atribacteraceae bacterium]